MDVMLKDAIKNYKHDTHRVCAPKETVRRILKIRKLTNIPELKNLSVLRIDNLDVFGIPVFKVFAGESSEHNRFMPNASHGKGATEAQALASGLMEFIERYSATHIDPSKIVVAKKTDIPDSISVWDLVPPNNIRDKFPKEDIDNTNMHWVRAYSLTNHKIVWVPLHLAYFYSNPPLFRFAEGNGLATGNTLEEAILHGICEVVERHLIESVVWNGENTRKISSETINEPEIIEIIKKIESKGFKIYLNDYTLDMGIPTISAVVSNKREIQNEFGLTLHSWNVGTHTSRKIATMRAITEALQSRSCFLFNMSNKDQLKHTYEELVHARYLKNCLVQSETKTINYEELPDISCENIKEEVRRVVNILSDKGYETIIADLTNNEVKMPVVRAIIKDLQPELRTFMSDWKTAFHPRARISRHLSIYGDVLSRFQSTQPRKSATNKADKTQ